MQVTTYFEYLFERNIVMQLELEFDGLFKNYNLF